ELVFGEAALQIRARVDARRAVTLDEQQVARMVLGWRTPEMVETDVVQRRRGAERGDVAAQIARLAVGAHHHRHRVPADDRADLPLQRVVAGALGLQLGRDGVDVFGGRLERQVRTGTPRYLDHPLQQLVRAVGTVALD